MAIKRNAFGQIIHVAPLFDEGDDPDGQGGGDDAKPEGFPPNTPLDQMTPEQQLAYWKYHARQHENQEKALKKQLADLPALKQKAEQYDQLEQQNKTEHERELDAAREEALQQGEILGASRYLSAAVKAEFRALTGKAKEDVDAAFAHVDVSTFIDDDGELDHVAIENFAKTFGAADDDRDSHDPAREVLNRHRRGSQPSGGSVKALMEQRKESLGLTKQ